MRRRRCKGIRWRRRGRRPATAGKQLARAPVRGGERKKRNRRPRNQPSPPASLSHPPMPANRAKPEPARRRLFTSRKLTEPPCRREAEPSCVMAGDVPLVRGARKRGSLCAFGIHSPGCATRLCDKVNSGASAPKGQRVTFGGRLCSRTARGNDSGRPTRSVSNFCGRPTIGRPTRPEPKRPATAGLWPGLAWGAPLRDPAQPTAAASADRFGSSRRGRRRRWRRLRTYRRPAWSCRNCGCRRSDRRAISC